MECPCRTCNDRTIGCHGNCEKYVQWSQEQEKLREIRNKKVNQERLADEDIIRRRMKKKK